MFSTMLVSTVLVSAVVSLGESKLRVYNSTTSPCDDPEFQDQPVCKAKTENEDCVGSGCWSCDEPLVSTECVLSNWITWKSQEDKFAQQCPGELVRFGQDSGVQDCGVACFGCSYIRACCDDCTSIFKVSGQWRRISCTDAETKVKYSWGVETTSTSSWSRTEKWSQAVSLTASLSGVVVGIAGSINLSASSSHSLEETTSGSWSQTTTENTSVEFTQPAETCSWHWRTTITDSCGQKTADTKDFILTSGSSRGNSPCCLPGLEMDESGNCPPDNAGNVVNLCKAEHTASSSEALIKRLSA